jgi:hypothetical protein
MKRKLLFWSVVYFFDFHQLPITNHQSPITASLDAILGPIMLGQDAARLDVELGILGFGRLPLLGLF